MKHFTWIAVTAMLLTCCIANGQIEVPEVHTQQMMNRLTGKEQSMPLRSEAIWTADAQDNAVCIRSIPDVTGDGIRDAVLGHGINQDGHNFFCYSGASSGTGSVVWSVETTGGLSGGYFWGDECISIASDADGNGYPNILAGLAGGGRFAAAYDGFDGTMLWQFNTYDEPDSGWIYSITELGDVTGDDIPEVIFGCGSDNDHAYCIDGSSTGTSPTVVWSLSLPDASYSVAAISDVNNDSLPDALISSGDTYGQHVYCVEGDSSGSANVLWTYDALDSVQAITVISDTNTNGAEDFIAGTWGSGVRCGDGITGNELWSNLLGGATIMMVNALPDVTGDGVDEVLVGSWDNAIYCLNGADGITLWTTPTGTLNGGDVWTIRATPDVDGDTFADVLAGSFDTNLYCVSGTDGSILYQYMTGNRVFSVSPGWDLNGDTVIDSLAGTQDTSNSTVVYAISGADDLPTMTPEPCINNGDVNQDSEVTASDAQVAFLIALGSHEPTYIEACAADCNGDQGITSGDAQLIFMTALGMSNCIDPI